MIVKFVPDYAVGDLNGDGKLNSRDVLILMKLAVEDEPEITPVCDINGDGKLNARDVVALMRIILAGA